MWLFFSREVEAGFVAWRRLAMHPENWVSGLAQDPKPILRSLNSANKPIYVVNIYMAHGWVPQSTEDRTQSA